MSVLSLHNRIWQYNTLNSVIPVPSPPITSLSQNFPNPFSESTVIGYSVAGHEHVKIEVYDLLGAKVKTLVDETLSSGYYSVPFSNETLADGIYYCRMICGDVNQVVKMISIK